jgi:hypothetical protein
MLAFSKKAENHVHMVALHFLYYNFVRIHQTLRMTPASFAMTAYPAQQETASVSPDRSA